MPRKCNPDLLNVDMAGSATQSATWRQVVVTMKTKGGWFQQLRRSALLPIVAGRMVTLCGVSGHFTGVATMAPHTKGISMIY